ncbi:biotin--[acetyl-CoA-carboxylase] ligase [Halarcobacter ebronensis]|uniref:Biotin--[acetyl-CoA-carboxylase] ligase n=1 Tax=Halarcobacter ebronensis TaxID=1462615 RepID=A0A4Q0YKL9_9BACT|nr:biotin--[acetyl-CoA-carboxylase] ligase [Halarcobacter ebronensis]QKF82712.1 biotin-[acetyl-CoA-carboxylase] ligase [Halarcobacter ebronensis]RXJ69769.1 biotin--[acetyl-CoA-carboxylase] ligase [Halarcobacter ebronensis]RXK06738.1 biotin--[acetyl-CoA-carboxylase] ligase [Halarcobacter ebronensis]
MKIIFLDEVTSTHTYLKELISSQGYSYPICITSKVQTDGIGSRGNSWVGKEGNLFFSFVMKKDELPKDLELQSASIFFSYILKLYLSSKGSNLWLKWPNDFYMGDKKIGGTITTVTKDLIYCGIGLNLVDVSDEYGKLDIKIDPKECLENYFDSLKKDLSWKDIFSLFKIEFQSSRKFTATINNEKVLLDNAILLEDGSIEINNVRVYSLR